MKKGIGLVLVWGLLCSLFCTTVHAQGKVYVCSGYTLEGEPVGPISNLSIADSGLHVYLLYANRQKINTHVISVFVDKGGDAGFEPYSNDQINPDHSQTWVATSYIFHKSGTYKISFFDEGYQELATGYITITNKKLKEEHDATSILTLSSKAEMLSEESKCVHCVGVKVHTCESVVNEKPVNEAALFTVPETSPFIYILVENFAGFSKGSIRINLYKTDGGKSAYVKTTQCAVIQGKEVAYLKYDFLALDAGNYNFVVYNDDLQPIGYKDVAIQFEKMPYGGAK